MTHQEEHEQNTKWFDETTRAIEQLRHDYFITQEQADISLTSVHETYCARAKEIDEAAIAHAKGERAYRYIKVPEAYHINMDLGEKSTNTTTKPIFRSETSLLKQQVEALQSECNDAAAHNAELVLAWVEWQQQRDTMWNVIEAAARYHAAQSARYHRELGAALVEFDKCGVSRPELEE